MALIRPLIAGKSYRVTYKSESTSGGASLLAVFWIPKHGSAVPDSQERDIAPASSGHIQGNVPGFDEARRIEIRVDLPDGAGSGLLEVLHDGKPHKQEQIDKDTTWTALVLPDR
jgi:hypothetical protein